MFCVLHENPGSEKMRGHLGTELSNKVTDTFRCTKQKVNNVVTFTVKQVDARGKDVDDWTFEIIDDAGGLGIPRITAPAPEESNDQKIPETTPEEWAAIAKTMRAIVQPPKSASFTALRDGLKKEMHKANSMVTYWIHQAVDRGILIETNKRFTYNIGEGEKYENLLPF